MDVGRVTGRPPKDGAEACFAFLRGELVRWLALRRPDVTDEEAARAARSLVRFVDRGQLAPALARYEERARARRAAEDARYDEQCRAAVVPEASGKFAGSLPNEPGRSATFVALARKR